MRPCATAARLVLLGVVVMAASWGFTIDPLPTSVAQSATSFSPSMGDVTAGKSVTSFGDVNGDGIADFANYRRVYRGPLSTPSAPVVNDPMVSMNLADFVDLQIVPDLNGDGRDDVLLRRVSVSSGQVTYDVRKTSASGTLDGNLFSVTVTGGGADITKVPGRLWVGDFNGDGHADLALWNEGRGAIMMVNGNAAGDWSALNLSDATTVTELTLNGGSPFTGRMIVRVGDADGDGDDDLVILTTGTLRDTTGTTASAGLVVVRRSAGATGATMQQVAGQDVRAVRSATVAGNTPRDLTVGDVDGDQRVEALAVVGYDPGSGSVPQSAILYSLGATPAVLGEVTPFTADTSAHIVADLDGDDLADLYAVGNYGGNGVTALIIAGSASAGTALATPTYLKVDTARLGYHDVANNGTTRYRPIAVDLDGDGANQLAWVEQIDTASTRFVLATPQLYVVEDVALKVPVWQGRAQPWWFVSGRSTGLTIYDGAQAAYTISATGLTATKTGSVLMKAALAASNDIDSDSDADPSATYTLAATSTGSGRVATITARGGSSTTFAYSVVPAISLGISGQTPQYAGEVGRPLTLVSTSGLTPLVFNATGAAVVDNGAVAGSAVTADGSGGFSDLPRHTWTVTPSATGTLTAKVSEAFGSDAIITVAVSPAASLVRPSGASAPTLGQGTQVAALNGGGSGHYSVTATGATVSAGSIFSTSDGLDLDADGNVDYGRYFTVTPTTTGTVVVGLTQSSPFSATGSVSLSVDEALGLKVSGQTADVAGAVGTALTLKAHDGAGSGYGLTVSPATAATVTAGTAFTTMAGTDVDGDGTADAGRPFSLLPSATGALTATATDSEGRSASVVITINPAVKAISPGATAPVPAVVGVAATVAVLHGVPAYTVTASGATVVAQSAFTDVDVDADGNLDDGRYFAVTPSATGTVTVAVTDAVGGTTSLELAVQFGVVVVTPDPLALRALGLSATAVSLGQAITVIAYDGEGAYGLSAPGAAIVAAEAFTSAVGIDVDNDEEADPGRRFLVIPTAIGTLTISVSDGAAASATLALVVTALPSVAVEAPTVTVSTGDRTIFTAVSPGTPQGLERLRDIFTGTEPTVRRGFLWDAEALAFVEAPLMPIGGALPVLGWFVASRTALALDFAGTPVPAPATLALRPGWNFIGIPPVQEVEIVHTSHLLDSPGGDDFTVVSATGAELAGTDRSDAIGSGAWWWDGAAYRKVTRLTSGGGYWIRNRLPGVVFLTRQAGVDRSQYTPTAVVEAVARQARAGEDTPPPPPASGKAAADVAAGEGGGACGTGAGLMGLLVTATMALHLASLRRRRPDCR